MLSNAFDRSKKTTHANPFLSTIFLQFGESLKKHVYFENRMKELCKKVNQEVMDLKYHAHSW